MLFGPSTPPNDRNHSGRVSKTAKFLQSRARGETNVFSSPGRQKMTDLDTGSSQAFTGLENNFTKSEVYDIAARLGGSEISNNIIPVSADFDPTHSYGQTRGAHEAEFECRYVSWLLERHKGNISAAAREARMDRKHLHDLAKKHGLRKPTSNRHR
jgi:transcriptional regulator with GAF, ATPase, and Fis domain